MRVERHQPFHLELAERLANRNSAHAELRADRVLTQRLALGIMAAKNSLADGVGGHARERLAAQRQQHELVRLTLLLGRLSSRPRFTAGHWMWGEAVTGHRGVAQPGKRTAAIRVE